MALRPKLNRVWASSSATLRRDPGDAKYLQGWISEIPTYQVLNFLQYKVDTTLLAQAERGIFEWGGDVQYQLGSVVWNEVDKKIYVSTVGNPSKTLTPNANLTQWAASSIQVPRASYDSIVAAITAHIADITGNPHKLTAGRIGAYNKAEIDALVAQYRALVSAHATDKNNPHGVTAAQAGAVPITGGTYTGDVTFNGGLFFDAGKVNQISKTNGLYLQAGSFVLGLNASGQAVAGTTSSQSPIVTEQSFPNLKMAREVLYAVPAPSFRMNLIRGIGINSGAGIMDANFNVAFSPSLGALVMQSDGNTFTLINDTPQMAPSSNAWTMAIDVAINISTPVVTSDTNIGLSINIEGQGAINIRNNGKVYANLVTGATPEVDLGNMNNWTRLVIVAAGSNVLLYVNGVIAGNLTTAVAGTTGGTPYIRAYPTSYRRQFWLRNWRMWQSDALSAAMVSTL